jgi:hypothetical protein
MDSNKAPKTEMIQEDSFVAEAKGVSPPVPGTYVLTTDSSTVL